MDANLSSLCLLPYFQILLHLFAMYMDRQLPPDIQQPDGRRFSSINVIKAPEKPPKPTIRPLLYLTQVCTVCLAVETYADFAFIL